MTGLTAEEYVSTEAWRDARLEVCPNHPDGCCSLASHGTYERKTPAGTRIARWYCRESHTTFSLLPEFLAARTPGTLDQVEEAVVAFETAPGVQAAARQARPGHHISDRGAERRWIRWRAQSIHRFLAVSGHSATCSFSVDPGIPFPDNSGAHAFHAVNTESRKREIDRQEPAFRQRSHIPPGEPLALAG